MGNFVRAAVVALLLSISVAGLLAAGPYEDAGAVYKRGDYPTALRLFRPLADQGNAEAQNRLGFMYEKGRGVAQDDAEAAKWYRKASEQGLARAQSNLGLLYAKGQGVAQGYAEAISWFRKAADQGNAGAQYNLGLRTKTATASCRTMPQR